MSRASGTPPRGEACGKHLLTTLLPPITLLSASIPTPAALIKLAGALNPREASSAAQLALITALFIASAAVQRRSNHRLLPQWPTKKTI
jgi:hypothetical protein